VLYLALPTLTAYLRQQGIQVAQHDVNRQLCEHLLDKSHLKRASAELRASVQAGHSGKTATLDMLVTDAVSGYVVDHIDEAKRVFQQPLDENPQRLDWARSMIYHAAQILTLPYKPSVWKYDSYRYNDKMTDDLKEAVDCAYLDAHVFVAPYRDKIVPNLLADGTRVFGICLAYLDQVIPALTLARVLREQAPEARIVIGGPIMPYVEKALAAVPEFFSLVDYVILGEGEEPLAELVRQIHGDGDFERVPSLTYRAADGTLRKTKPAPPLAVSKSPAPEFDDNTPDKYWIHVPALPYVSARGCYWSKCDFCSINSTYGFGARSKPVPVVIEELTELKRKYGADCFELSDEAMSPSRMRQFSEALLDAGLEIYWFSLARLENGFTREILDLAYRAGLRVISWGMESGSQNVLDLMNKGTRAVFAQRVLRDSAAAGIWNHAFAMFGFPGETEENVEETLRFVEQTGEAMHSLAFGTFRLEQCSPLFDNAQQRGLTLHSYPSTYIRPDYQYDENGVSGFSVAYARVLRAQAFLNGYPSIYARYALPELLGLLAKRPGAREKIKQSQLRYAARVARAAAILADSQAWDFALEGCVVWKSLPTVDLMVALDLESGKAIALQTAIALAMQSPRQFQRLLAKATTTPQPQGDTTVEVLTMALQALPIRAQRKPFEPAPGLGAALGSRGESVLPEGTAG
jgi:hypothetical protein